MKLRNKAAMLLAFSMMVSLGSVATVNAAEMENEFSTLKESSSFEEVAEVGSLEQFKGDSIDKIKMDDSGIALTATGDSYEANNGPAVATKGRYNKITYASLHDANDVDWYTIEVLDTSKPISVFLTNIPSGCDYDMYLLMNGGEGMIKFIIGKEYGEVLGVHILGPRATDLIGECALAIGMEATVDEIYATIHAHPTVTEAVREAALAATKRAIHIPNK